MLFVIVVYYATYVPVNLNLLVRWFPDWYHIVSRYLAYTDGITNGILYVVLYRATRADFLAMFSSRSRRVGDVTGATAAAAADITATPTESVNKVTISHLQRH